ncbi:MAG: type II toxin-antitoxin system HicA family toxin [Patescibacteria group bacterium]
MSQIPVLKPKELIRALERAGFLFVRQRGSHRVFTKEDMVVTVPYHSRDMRVGTLKSILRYARLTAEDLLRLL